MASQAKREGVFRARATAFRAISDLGDEDLYACPTCGRFFDAEAPVDESRCP